MDEFDFLHGGFDRSDLPISKTNKSILLPSIFIIEDDRVLGQTIQKYLTKVFNADSQQIIHFSSTRETLQFFSSHQQNAKFILITDVSLDNDNNGLQLIDQLKEKQLEFESLVVTGFASIEDAILATKKGVHHYLTKPFELEVLKQLVVDLCSKSFGVNVLLDKAPEKFQQTHQRAMASYKVDVPKEADIFQGMIGRSAKMKQIFERIAKVAPSDSTVLITGPSGTGKELVARAIHKLSRRREKPIINVNCGAIPSELLESELFGHMKGSFTGAISDRKGRFELADQGTIFLDEIGDMPPLLQVKLLRVLQNRTIEPVGGTQKEVNVRIVTATHRDLEKASLEGKFREDLFYRLNVIPIKVPALKERREDIPLLLGFFLSKYSSADGRNSLEFSDEVLELLMTYDWPGNVRELENLVERLVILRGGATITPEDLPAKIYRNNPLATSLYQGIFELPDQGLDLRHTITEIENSLILQALKRTAGNKNQASKLLQINRTTLIEKLKKKGIHLENYLS